MARRIAHLLVLWAVYFFAVDGLFTAVQRRVWNRFGAIDLLAMTAAILPFVLLPTSAPGRDRFTKYAWALATFMALDLVFFLIGEFAPTGGHPSLEALGSLFLGTAKIVLLPAATLLLSVAALRGERLIVLALGCACLIAETIYGLYPPPMGP